MSRDQTSLFWLGLFLLFILLCLSLATGAGVYGAREVLGYLMGDARWAGDEKLAMVLNLSLIHISEPTRRYHTSRMPSSA